jgi:hypothetical protein
VVRVLESDALEPKDQVDLLQLALAAVLAAGVGRGLRAAFGPVRQVAEGAGDPLYQVITMRWGP